MKAAFGADVTAVHVADSGSVRIDVFTTYALDPDGAEAAGVVAREAARSSVVLAANPSTRIEAFVWPTGKEFYMTRASASYTDGKLDAPMDVFTNAGLQ